MEPLSSLEVEAGITNNSLSVASFANLYVFGVASELEVLKNDTM